MKHLIFDTETTGKWDHSTLDDARQPHIVQFAALLVDDNCDPAQSIKSQVEFLVKPDGWTIPAEVTAIHGITTETATAYGVPVKLVLSVFKHMAAQAGQIVAHNIAFDRNMIQVEERRCGVKAWLPENKQYCTMQESTDILKLPGKFNRYKWPTLAEAYLHFTGRALEGAHGALADTRGCLSVFRFLMALQAPTPTTQTEAK